MASAHIRLEVDPKTRKRTVVIAYESDADMLPHEHEEAHREVLQKLFEGGLIKEGDDIKVEREAEKAPDSPQTQEQTTREGVKQGS
jgi:hypothetical protein